jgi:hypothetical protein
VLLKQLTRSTLRQATSADGVNVTRVDLERGQVGAEIDTAVIEGAGQRYDLQVDSPRSTLAIKGTRVALYDQRPYDVEARSFTGEAVFERFDRQRVAFGRKNGGTVTVTGENPDPAAVALVAAVSDPGPRNARTASEQRAIANVFSRAGGVRFDPVLQLPVVTGGPVAGPSESLRPFFTGGLGLGITWDAATNLNIAVFENPGDNSRGRVLFPVRDFARQPGASIPFDHRGGANGGFEVANFETPTNGSYIVFANNPSDAPATAQFTAFAGGQQLSLFDVRTFQSVLTPSAVVRPGRTVFYQVFFGEDPPPAIDLPDFPDLPEIDVPLAARANRPAAASAEAVRGAAPEKPSKAVRSPKSAAVNRANEPKQPAKAAPPKAAERRKAGR